jgi:hypothetical protein
MAPAEIVELSLLQQFFRLNVAGLVTKNKHRIFCRVGKNKNRGELYFSIHSYRADSALNSCRA